MSIDFLDHILDKSVSFDFLVDSFDNEIDLLLILAGRVVLSVYRLLKFAVLLIRTVGFVRRRLALFQFRTFHPSLAMPLDPKLILFTRFLPLRSIEDVLVFGKRSLVRGDYAVVTNFKVVLKVFAFLANSIRRKSHFILFHDCLFRFKINEI